MMFCHQKRRVVRVMGFLVVLGRSDLGILHDPPGCFSPSIVYGIGKFERCICSVPIALLAMLLTNSTKKRKPCRYSSVVSTVNLECHSRENGCRVV